MKAKKDYIIVKDRHPRISEVLNDCVSLCVPTCKNEPLSSILQKICNKLTVAISDLATLGTEVDELQETIGTCPTLSEDANNILECRDDGLYATASEGGGETMRFGFAGEDDTATEFRQFDTTGFDFEIFQDAGNTVLGLYYQPTYRELYTQVRAPDGEGAYAYIDMRSDDFGGYSVLDLYVQDDTSNNWGEITLENTSLYIANQEISIEGLNGNALIQLTEDASGGDSQIYLQAWDGNNGGIFAPFIDLYSGSDGTDGYIDIYIAGNGVEDAIDIFMTPGLMTFQIDSNANWLLDGITQDDTSEKILAMDANDNVKWVDKATIGSGSAPSLQAVTDIGNTTDNQIISSVLDTYAYIVEREGVQFGVGFAIEAGGTGWGGTYLGGSMEFTPSINSDKANIYIGVNPGQGRVPGGEFDTMIGYQAGLGHNGSDYKFYLAQGSSNHLMYGDFYTGDLWIKSRVRIGQTYDGTGPTIPADPEARLDIVAGSTTIAPLKFTAGTNLTTPVNGTMEFDGANLYITIAGVRKTIALVP